MPETLPAALKEILRLITTLPNGNEEFDILPSSLRNRTFKQLTLLVRRLKGKHDLRELLSELAAVGKTIAEEQSACDGLAARARKRLAATLDGILSELEKAAKAINPIEFPQDTFNPFAPKVVGELIANTLLAQHRKPLDQTVATRFYGAGVYALYYVGPFDAYSPISKREHPIYVGKSDPVELHAVDPKQQGQRLFRRLADHYGNLSNVNNLAIRDFECRFLVVHSAWVTPAEAYLVEHFRPVWNKEMKVCSGFGKHGDASSTRANKRSPWDILHPGREWATSRQGKTADEVRAAIAEHFAKYPVTASLNRGRHSK